MIGNKIPIKLKKNNMNSRKITVCVVYLLLVTNFVTAKCVGKGLTTTRTNLH